MTSHRGYEDNPNPGGTNHASSQVSNGIEESSVVNRRRAIRSVIQKQSSMVHLLLLVLLGAHDGDNIVCVTVQIEEGRQAQGKSLTLFRNVAKTTNWYRIESSSIFLYSLSTFEVRILDGCAVIMDSIWQER